MFFSTASRLLAAVTLSAGFAFVPVAQGDEIKEVVSSEFGHTFGLFGPMPFSGVTEDLSVTKPWEVVIPDARYGSTELGEVTVNVEPIGDRVYDIRSGKMPLNFTGSDGSSVKADRWEFTGEWNHIIKGYQALDYIAEGLVIKTAEGTTYTVAEVKMTADDNGYSLRLSDLSGIGGKKPAKAGDPDTSFLLFVSNILYEGRWTGNAAGAPYAALGRSLDWRFLNAREEGGDALVGATLKQLEDLYLPASSSFTDLQISGLSLVAGQYDLEIELDSFALPAASKGDDLKEQTVNVKLEGLDIRRREDFASLGTTGLTLDLSGADVKGFSAALASLFKEAEAGANWGILADIILFFDTLAVEGTADNLVFALPDRLFSLSMQRAEGAVALTDMRLDGGFVTLRGLADGIELTAMESPKGVEPEPIVVPSIVPALGGRLIRFDELSQSLVPNQARSTIEITGLPMANLRQTLSSLPRQGSIENPRGLARSLAGGALALVTPFLIQPPRVEVSDTEAVAEDYKMSITGEHQVMAIPPLFGFGSFTAEVEGLKQVEARANTTTETALATGGEEAADLADYGRRIAGWSKRFQDLGTVTSGDSHSYTLELTQFGEILLNGTPFNQ